MGALKRIVRFGVGGVVGAVVGGASAYLFAPQSGDEMTGTVRQRLADARLAGAEAKAAKEREMIGRFRAVVNDPAALTATQIDGLAEVAEASTAAAVASASS